MRLATYTTVLERTAPRLLSRDILRGKDQKIRAVLKVIAQTKPNILALQSFDWDAQLRAARAFKDALNAAGWAMPYLLVPRPKNAGAKAVADPSNIGIPSLDAVDWPNKQPAREPARQLYTALARFSRARQCGALAHGAVAEASPHRLIWMGNSIP